MKDKNINILFLGGAKRVSLAEYFIEAGNVLGFEVRIFSYELDVNVPISFIGEVIFGLRWTDLNLVNDLIGCIEKNNIHVVIPFLDPATLVAAKLKGQTKACVLVSDFEECELYFDKKKALEFYIKEKILTPPSSTNEFPLIAKPCTGSASKGIIIFNNFDEFNGWDNQGFLIQKFIEGIEYSVDVYISINTREIISIVPRIRLETQGGESIKTKTIRHQSLINKTKEIINKTKLIGPITLQFIEESNTKELYLIEVNPRFGGAAIASIGAGANTPLYILKDLNMIKNNFQDDWQDNLLMIRRFSEYFRVCK